MVKETNLRRQRYKKYRLEGMSAFASAVKAGYSRNTAKNARKYMENNGTFQEILEIAGVTNKKIAEMVNKGFNAKYENGKPNWNIMHKFLDTAVKLNKLIDTAPLIEEHTHFNYGWKDDNNKLQSSRVPENNTQRSS